MATTRYKIAEQIMSRLNGGRVGNASQFHINEIKMAVGQAANQLLKMEYLSTNLPMMEFIPNGAAIATYEDIAVVQYKNVSKSVLPCMPLKLPRSIGVFQIMDPDDANACFIPLESSMAALITSQPVLSGLFGYTGYEVYGTDVIYTSDITGGTSTVTMRLVVMDMDHYTDYDILPVSAEQEMQIVQQVLQLYAGDPGADKLVDPGIKQQRGPLRDQIQK